MTSGEGPLCLVIIFIMLINCLLFIMSLCLLFIMSLCLIVFSFSMQVIEQYEQPQGKLEVRACMYGTDKEESYTEWETIDLGLRCGTRMCRTRRTTRWRSGL